MACQKLRMSEECFKVGITRRKYFLPQLIWIAFLVDEVLMHKSRMAHSSPKLQTLQTDHCVVHL